jgi:hypothetical protein
MFLDHFPDGLLMKWPNHRKERGRGFLEVVDIDLMIGLIHDSYRRWERGHKFHEAVEVDLTIRLVHDSYRRWERGRRFLLWMKISCCLVRASCALLIGLE